MFPFSAVTAFPSLVALVFASTAFSALAVDLDAVRSASRHKVIVEHGDRKEGPATATFARRIDYGSFSVLEVDRLTADRMIAAGLADNGDRHNFIFLNTGPLDTSSPAIAAQFAPTTLKAAGPGRQLYLVQFPGPIRPEWYASLQATGAQIVNFIPSSSYLVYAEPGAVARLAQLAEDGVAQWMGPYLADYKLQPSTRQAGKGAPTPATLASDRYQIQLVRDPAANADTIALLTGLSLAGIESRYEFGPFVNLISTLASVDLSAVAGRPDVISIHHYAEPRRRDERQNMILAGNLTGSSPTPGNYFTLLSTWGFTQAQFDASGLVVDVADDGADRNPTGADPGTLPTNAVAGPVAARHFSLYRSGDRSLASRFVYKGRWGSGSTADGGLGLGGHGQLNMSIIGGFVPDGFDTANALVHRDAQGFRYGLGVAPFVRLGNSVIFDPGFTNPSFPAMVAAAYGAGARISSNSWGANVSGAYTADSQAYDGLVRDAQSGTAGNQPMIFLFSAGNAGSSGARTIGSPGSAKNVITVGAAENVRSHAEANGGNAGNLSGSDGCGTNDTGADSSNDIIGFSSRGPTADGRFKPDLVGPGTHITGMAYVAASAVDPLTPPNHAGTGDPAFRADGVCALPNRATTYANRFFPVSQRWYTTSSGTSHSTPALAGAAALVYQQFINNPAYIATHRVPAGSAPPSPAMVKAYLLNSTRYLTGTLANDTLPSMTQGMGSGNLGMAFDGVQRIVRDQLPADRFTASGQVRRYYATVTDASRPLRVTLAWTDVIGSTTGAAYVNDLDLVVVIGGQTYRGNAFLGATSSAGGVADLRNNVESVFIAAGLPVGTQVVVEVRATNIAGQADPTVTGLNQDFALVGYNLATTSPFAALTVSSAALPTGNGAIEPNECNDLLVSLANVGGVSATAISGTISTSAPGVTIAQGTSAYPNLAVDTQAANSTVYRISTSPSVVCGSLIDVTHTAAYSGGPSPVSTTLQFRVGVPSVPVNQNFDAVTPPALPPGWTSTVLSGSAPAWITSSASGIADSAPVAAVTNGIASVGSNALVTPAVLLPVSPTGAVLTFRHRYNFETDFDGGVLELSTNGGTTWNDILSAGATFITGGYTRTLSAAWGNPLGGRLAWSGVISAYTTVSVQFPASLNGQTVLLRWHGGWDSSAVNSGVNWRVDNVTLTAGYTCTSGSGVCAPNTPPNVAYAPAVGSTVAMSGVTIPGSTGTGTITATPSGGSGIGSAATTTINGCALTGANAASFSGAASINLTFVGDTTAAQTFSVSCTSGDADRTATLTCTETKGLGSGVGRSWPLRCPAGCSLDINADGTVTAAQDALLLSRYLMGFRGAALIAGVTLGPGRPNAAAVEAFIGDAVKFDVFGRSAPVVNSFQDALVLARLMLGVSNSDLLTGVTVPSGATLTTGASIRSAINARCGTSF